MRIGDNEPDVEALLTTLRAITDHPDHFSYGAISIAARTAINVIQQSDAMPAGAPMQVSQCEGQLSIHDLEVS